MSALRSFYAVTETSVYFVKDRRSASDPSPVAIKIALKGESRIAIGTELQNGTMIAITTQLQAYIPEGGGITSFERKIEKVNSQWWGGHSSAIIALFTSKKKAMDCFNAPDLIRCDPRWIEDTKTVTEKIGEDHRAFEVCRHPGLCLALFDTEMEDART